MKLILSINRETLIEQEIADLRHKRRIHLNDRVGANGDYIRLVVMALKVRYQKILQVAEWEIYLVCESRMNRRKSFLEKREKYK